MYLKLTAYYALKLYENGGSDEKARNIIMNTISVMVSNFEFSEKDFEALIERMNGMAYAAQARSKEEVYIRLMDELMAGHTDFVAGAKEYLAKDAAKNAYKK